MRSIRTVLGIILSVFAASGLIMALEKVTTMMYPLPAGANMNDPETMKKVLSSMPTGAYLSILVVYIIASFAGGIIASLIAGRKSSIAALIMAILLTIAGVWDAIYLHQPIWFAIVNVIVYVPFAWLGYKVVKLKPKMTL